MLTVYARYCLLGGSSHLFHLDRPQGIVVSNAVPEVMDKVTAFLQHQTEASDQEHTWPSRLLVTTKPRSAGVLEGLQLLGFLQEEEVPPEI